MPAERAAEPDELRDLTAADELPTSPAETTATRWSYEIVVVTYRSRAQVEQLLAGLAPDQPVAVVDNSGDIDGIASVVAARPGARYVAGAGKGFGRAANLGARTSQHEFVVFCNPDTRPTTAVLDELVQVLADDPLCASASALPVDENGAPQLGAVGWEPTVLRTAVHAFGLYRLLPHRGLVARPAPGRPVEADWLTGACLAVRTATFLELGGFDETFFVYSEDVALGRAARARGLRQVMRTDLQVPHAGGGSGAPSLEMNRLKGASMVRYLRRHNAPGAATAMVALLLLGYVFRILERLVHGDVGTARSHVAYMAGITTGRATVAGVEVTRG